MFIGKLIMSIVFSSTDGWIISHLDYLNNVYQSVNTESGLHSLTFNNMLFEINSQYLRQNQLARVMEDNANPLPSKTRKRKRNKLLPQDHLNELNFIQQAFNKLISSGKLNGLFGDNISIDNNEAARSTSEKFYSDTFHQRLENLYGCNNSDVAIIWEAQYKKYVFPKKCSFYCYDVRNMTQKMELNNQYDFVLLDPPWWNKSIRRKKSKSVEASYQMMYNEELVKIPIGKLLCSNGIVAIWCTNAPSHLNSIFNEIFPSWGVTYKAKWYWVKVTQMGNTICNFTSTPGKQPYELIILGCASDINVNIPDGKLIISVPSAVHSHKPPLIEVIKEYLPSEPKCLEIFARYLLPGWTSWGLEVLKFQDLSLYTILEHVKNNKDATESVAVVVK
ncbi:PREDICTED: methyltransferase-like protein 4 [Polistes canadensis]|uniref:methyltransferase-like protein 4 n=1 Tax=Polistes canadensis TaxID=91411 RepID=UPI000718C46D|nr:PREDICTED: methyltransferase-like protein 4 [Polistes canadensis]KAI4478900.1 hypothetical protein M0804_011646 [Polistes exclamans]